MVDVHEYTAMFGIFGTPKDQLEEAFRQLDLNGNGKLEPQEVDSAMKEFLTSDDPASRGNFLFGPV